MTSASPQARRRAGRARTQALEQEIAEQFGFSAFADYFADRRERGWSLAQIAAEAGRDRSWMARAAAIGSATSSPVVEDSPPR